MYCNHPTVYETDVSPQQLYAQEPPPPSNANAIVLNGANAYIEFSGGRVDVLDFTKDWSVAVSIHTQGQGIEGSNMSTFGTGTVSLNLKVQGAPLYNSNYGQYNTSAHNLYDTATRFNSNSWRAPQTILGWLGCTPLQQGIFNISFHTKQGFTRGGETYLFRRPQLMVKQSVKVCALVSLGMVQVACCLMAAPILGH